MQQAIFKCHCFSPKNRTHTPKGMFCSPVCAGTSACKSRAARFRTAATLQRMEDHLPLKYHTQLICIIDYGPKREKHLILLIEWILNLSTGGHRTPQRANLCYGEMANQKSPSVFSTPQKSFPMKATTRPIGFEHPLFEHWNGSTPDVQIPKPLRFTIGMLMHGVSPTETNRAGIIIL